VTATQQATVAPRCHELKALFVNATLKRSPEARHTEGSARRSSRLVREHGVQVGAPRADDRDIATGMWPDMTEHGAEVDALPAIFREGAGRRHPGPRWPRSGSGTTARS
jgi:hypothetical protein